MMSNYTKQQWKNYDESKDFQTNVSEGAVATAERMHHIEEGIYAANVPYTVGSVTTGTEAAVTINPDKSIDFVIPEGGVGESFGITTSSPVDGIISKDSVIGENPAFILGPDGIIYEVKGKDTNEDYIVEASQSVQIKGEKGDPGEQGPAGEDGANGLSAYELWKTQPGNESKSEEEFLASLKGEKGDQGDVGPQGEKGETGEQGPAGADGEKGDQGDVGPAGQSAYELWKSKPGNESKTEDDFLNSLKGADGEDGQSGTNGQSAYELWKSQEGNEDKSEQDFLDSLKGTDGQNGQDGAAGLSAYDIWLKQPGNEGKSEEEFLASLKGEKGDPGESTGEGGGTMAIGHPTLGDVSILNEGSNDVKLSIKYTDPENEGVPYGGMVVAVKEDSYPESPTDCDWSVDVMTKDKYKSTALEIPIENNKGTERDLFLTLFPYSSDRVYNMLKREKWNKSVKFFDKSMFLEEKEQYSMTSSYNQEDLTPYLASGILASDGNIYFTNRDGNILFKYDTTLKSISVAATLSSDEEKNLNKYEEAGITFEHDKVPQNNCTRVAELDGELYTIVTYAVVGKTGFAQTDILKKDGDQLKVFSTSAFQSMYRVDWMLVPLDGKLAIFKYGDGAKKMYIYIVDPSDKSNKFISKTDINISNTSAKSYFASNYVISDDKKSVYVVMRCNMNEYHMVMKITVNYEESSMDCVLIMLPNEDLPKQNVLFVEDDNNIKVYENHSSEKDIVIKYVYVGKDNSTPQSAMEIFRKNDTNIAEYPAQIMRYIGDEVLTAMYSSSDKNSITSVELGSVAKS